MKSSFHRLISFLPFPLNHLGLSSPEFDPLLDDWLKLFFNWTISTSDNSLQWPSLSVYNPSARTTQKTQPILGDACLLIRCLAIDVLLLCALAPSGMCLASRCLAMGTHDSVWSEVLTAVLGYCFIQCVTVNLTSWLHGVTFQEPYFNISSYIVLHITILLMLSSLLLVLWSLI
jgi:heme/copper-type cytochrome/quinol oxidase subunit 4